MSAWYAAWAFLNGATPDEIGAQAAVGAAVGFFYGLPITVFAAVLLSSTLN